MIEKRFDEWNEVKKKLHSHGKTSIFYLLVFIIWVLFVMETIGGFTGVILHMIIKALYTSGSVYHLLLLEDIVLVEVVLQSAASPNDFFGEPSVSQTSNLSSSETYKITHIKITTLQFSRAELVFVSENLPNVL